MKRRIILNLTLASAAVVVLAIAAASGEAVKSAWTAAPLQIDGNNADWADLTFFHEKKVNVDYAFRNDGAHLYIVFIFNDFKFLSTIEGTGIKVYVNTEGKKKKDWGLRFFKKMAMPEDVIVSMEQKGQIVSEEEKARIRAGKIYAIYDYALLAKTRTKSSSSPPAGGDSPDLPKFRYVRADQATVYEFRIPLAKNDALPAGIGTEPGKTIKIGFEWGGLTEEMKAARLQRGAADVTGVSKATENMGQRLGASVRAPAGSGIPPAYDFWIDVQLAEPPSSAAEDY